MVGVNRKRLSIRIVVQLNHEGQLLLLHSAAPFSSDILLNWIICGGNAQCVNFSRMKKFKKKNRLWQIFYDKNQSRHDTASFQ
jgi:hypothetical protein